MRMESGIREDGPFGQPSIWTGGGRGGRNTTANLRRFGLPFPAFPTPEHPMSSPVRRAVQLRSIPAAILLALGAGRAGAQRATYTNFNSWYMFGAEGWFTNRWSANLDLQERRSGPIRQPTAFFFRPSVNYALNAGAVLTSGAFFEFTFAVDGAETLFVSGTSLAEVACFWSPE